MFKVKDVMTRQYISVRPEDYVDQAVGLMLEHQISGLPVIDDGGALHGVITEFDIIDMVYELDIQQSRVEQYMTREVQTFDPDDSLDEAACRFCHHTVRRFPVVSEGKVVGVMARRDLIRFVRDARRKESVY